MVGPTKQKVVGGASRNPHLYCLPPRHLQGSGTRFVLGILNKTQIRWYGHQVLAAALKSGLFVSKWVMGHKDQKDGENLYLKA